MRGWGEDLEVVEADEHWGYGDLEEETGEGVEMKRGQNVWIEAETTGDAGTVDYGARETALQQSRGAST